MENIFERAYFGKAYKTRDGKKAVYLGDNTCWIEGGETEIGYSRNGLFVDFQEHGIDIVSEWPEEIDEEKLDKLAEYWCPESGSYREGDILVQQAIRNAYKAGYRKALESYD